MPTLPRPNGLVARSMSVLLVCLLALPAYAVDKVKSADAMGAQASQAYEAGQHARAAQLYLEAYRTNPARPDFLFAAARSEHLAGQAEKAIDQYRQALAHPGLKPAARAKAEGYLRELLDARAEQKVAGADHAAKTGDYKLAASIYLAVFEELPTRFEYLYKAALAAHLARDLAAAERHFVRYLDLAPATAQDRHEARARLESLQRAKATPPLPPPPVQSKPSAPPPPPPTVTAAPPPVPWPGWTVVGAGSLLGIASIGLWAGTLEEADALDGLTAQRDDAGKIRGIGYAEYSQRHDDLRADRQVAAVVAGAAVVTVGLGTWLVLRPSGKAGPATAWLAPLPSLQGVAAGLHF